MAAEYIGLLGTALGAAIAAGVNLLLSRQNVKSEDRQWTRNARLMAYKEFLSAGTSLSRACVQVAESTEPDKVSALATPTVRFDEAYIVLQILSDASVLLAARKYKSWFPDLIKAARHGKGAEVEEIGWKAREMRQAFLKEVRQEQGLAADKEILPALQ